MSSYEEIVRLVERHGAVVGPQEKNRYIDHIWHLREEDVSPGGQGGGPAPDLPRAGKLCRSCARSRGLRVCEGEAL